MRRVDASDLFFPSIAGMFGCKMSIETPFAFGDQPQQERQQPRQAKASNQQKRKSKHTSKKIESNFQQRSEEEIRECVREWEQFGNSLHTREQKRSFDSRDVARGAGAIRKVHRQESKSALGRRDHVRCLAWRSHRRQRACGNQDQRKRRCRHLNLREPSDGHHFCIRRVFRGAHETAKERF